MHITYGNANYNGHLSMLGNIVQCALYFEKYGSLFHSNSQIAEILHRQSSCSFPPALVKNNRQNGECKKRMAIYKIFDYL